MAVFTLTDLLHGFAFHDINFCYSALIIQLMNGAEVEMLLSDRWTFQADRGYHEYRMYELLNMQIRK